MTAKTASMTRVAIATIPIITPIAMLMTELSLSWGGEGEREGERLPDPEPLNNSSEITSMVSLVSAVFVQSRV